MKGFYKFTVEAGDKTLDCYYPSKAELKRCVGYIFGGFTVVGETELPVEATEEMIAECPETAFVKAANLTFSHDFYRRVLISGCAYPILYKGWQAYLVKDKEAFERCRDGIAVNSIDYFQTKIDPGHELYWQIAIVPHGTKAVHA